MEAMTWRGRTVEPSAAARTIRAFLGYRYLGKARQPPPSAAEQVVCHGVLVRGEILTANILSGAGLVIAACRAQPWQSTSPVTRREDDVAAQQDRGAITGSRSPNVVQ